MDECYANASGETDLATLLRSLSPKLHDTPRIFVSVGLERTLTLPCPVIGQFVEDEGVTLILEAPLAIAHGLATTETPQWAQITLTVHSSLSAVGMMAAVASDLAHAGIPCNPVSGYFHDHLFVPWDSRLGAVKVLHHLVNNQ
jgi:hypothetical protein